MCSKGAMSEAEFYVLRARLNGGIRNKAARGELRRGLPVGFVWGEADGEVRFHPDEAVVRRSPRSSPDSPRPDRRGECGCGFDRKAFACLCKCISGARSVGWRPATPPSTTC